MQYLVNTDEILGDLIDGEVVLLDLTAGTYYNLEKPAATIWQWIQAGASRDAILEAMTRAYPGTEQLQADLQAFLSDLLRHRLILEGQTQAGTAEGGDPPGPEFTGAYRAPRLSAYADMQELLQLDPVHEAGDQGWPTVPTR